MESLISLNWPWVKNLSFRYPDLKVYSIIVLLYVWFMQFCSRINYLKTFGMHHYLWCDFWRIKIRSGLMTTLFTKILISWVRIWPSFCQVPGHLRDMLVWSLAKTFCLFFDQHHWWLTQLSSWQCYLSFRLTIDKKFMNFCTSL